ncbi:hypothetical protein [Pseudoruminococcus massiliensis]|uniref:hypothetical protein n=1 Tax=Pseudoruminococcus massiliensis TaxID=2086583 RepID=UPI0022E54014|nr:hypothetical protein [Pseudoruminococcus massiliensis]
MKNKVKITALILALMVSIASIVGCSNNNSTSTEASVSSNSSIESSIESSIGESSVSESSAEISSETTSATESSVSSNSSAVDPVVEERSYSKEEQTEFQDIKIPGYKYYPASGDYYYLGDERVVTIQSVFSTCPKVNGNTIKEIIVPETVTKIPKGAFTGCTNLEKLVILNPDCEIEDGRILPKADPNAKYNSYNNKLINIYCYFRSDKTIPKQRLVGIQGCSKVFNALGGSYTGKDFDKCMHDLAEESYE